MTTPVSTFAADAPADGRLTRVLLAVVRVTAGLLWVQNLSWKSPKGPSFGGLRYWTQNAVDHQVFAPYTWFVKHIVLKNFTFFGWTVLVIEGCLGAFLLVGLATRFWALVGLAQTTAITLSALNTPGEWFWSYMLMYALQLTLLATAAGRVYGVDGALRPTWRASSSPLSKLLVVAS